MKRKPLSASFVTGAIALVFLIIGYEVAVFIHKAAVTRIEANRDHPDTVYVYVNSGEDATEEETLSSALLRNPVRANAPESVSPSVVRHNAKHSPVVEAVRARSRKVESFSFNPNTVSVEDLQRLGFVYDRLEPYIVIPKLDINKADSTALLDLPGIGPYFAGKIVSYRTSLRGYSAPEQLMEIYHFDPEKYDGLKDLITCSAPEPYPIWTLSEDELSKHPHISRTEAHSIVIYREHHKPSECTFEGLRKAGTLSEEHAGKLSLCKLQSAAAATP